MTSLRHNGETRNQALRRIEGKHHDAKPRVRRTKMLAREYASELLQAQDDPEWTLDKGLTHDEGIMFLSEVRRIGERIGKSNSAR